VLGDLEVEVLGLAAEVDLGGEQVVLLGHRVGGNSTSTTGPMMREIRPTPPTGEPRCARQQWQS
jgi:hypothetical protein